MEGEQGAHGLPRRALIEGGYVAENWAALLLSRTMPTIRNISRAATYAQRCCVQHLWAHARRKVFELADIAASKGRKNAPPISLLAMEAVKRIDLLFDIERDINGKTAARRHAVRQELSAPLVAELETWMQNPG